MYDKHFLNKKFNYLTIKSFNLKKSQKEKRSFWDCRCKCGKKVTTQIHKLKSGKCKSCGCLKSKLMSKRTRLNITGKTFHYLKVIKFVKMLNNQSYWKCQCKCGKIKTIIGPRITSGNTKSCGCLRIEKNKIRKSKLKKGEASFNWLYKNYKERAKSRNLDFKLTKFEFKLLTKQKCTYCNIKPNSRIGHKRLYGFYRYNGIDRINNKKGYVYKNCITCCKQCNIMKYTYSQNKFLTKIEKIYEHIFN